MALSRTNLLGQITAGNFGTADFTTTAFTPPSSSLLVVGASLVENNGTTSDPLAVLTISDSAGLTWTSRVSASVSPTSFPTATRIWTAPVTTGTSMTVTVSTGGRTIGEYSVSIVAYTGYDTSTPTGATATGTQNGGFSGPPTPFSITMSGAPASTSEVFAVAGMDKSVAGATPGSAFTEIDDLENTNWGGLESEVRTSSTSTTVDWVDLRSGGGALFNCACVAVEIRAAATSSAGPPQPIVAGFVAQLAAPMQPALLRGSLANPPVLTTPGPIVVPVPQTRAVPTPALLLRNTLVDPANTTPIVVSTPWVRTLPPPVTLLRGDLADPPVLTTPQPIVVALHPRPVLPPPTLTGRASLVDATAPAVATPQPIVAGWPSPWAQVPQPTILRGSTDNPPVLTTPGPIVAQLPQRPAVITPAVLVRSTLVDQPGTSPLVVLAPTRFSLPPQAVLLRSSLVDPATPQPLVVALTQPLPVVPQAVMVRAPVVAGTVVVNVLVLEAAPPDARWSARLDPHRWGADVEAGHFAADPPRR